MTDIYRTRQGPERITPCVPMTDLPPWGFSRLGILANRDLMADAMILRDGDAYKSIEPSGQGVRSALNFHGGAEWSELVLSAQLHAERAIGPCYIHQSRINYKSGMDANGWKWHSDFETWHHQDGMPLPRCVTVMIALEDNTPFNGPLNFLAGSHRFYIGCAATDNVSAEENFSDQKEGLPSSEALSWLMEQGCYMGQCLLDKGEAVMFDCNVLHASGQSLSPGSRTNAFFVFNAIGNELVAPFSGLPPRPKEMAFRH